MSVFRCACGAWATATDVDARSAVMPLCGACRGEFQRNRQSDAYMLDLRLGRRLAVVSVNALDLEDARHPEGGSTFSRQVEEERWKAVLSGWED